MRPHSKLLARIRARPWRGKFSYDCELAARMGAQAAITRRKGDRTTDRLWVYRCHDCGRWHMTSSPPRPHQHDRQPVTATSLGIGQ